MNNSDDRLTPHTIVGADSRPLIDPELAGFVRLADVPGETLIERLRTLKKRAAKQSLTVRYDADIVEYYRSKGKGYQKAMNDALRVCMEAEKGTLRP